MAAYPRRQVFLTNQVLPHILCCGGDSTAVYLVLAGPQLQHAVARRPDAFIHKPAPVARPALVQLRSVWNLRQNTLSLCALHGCGKAFADCSAGGIQKTKGI